MGFGLGSILGAALPVVGSFLGSKGSNNPGNVAGSQLQRIPQYGYNAYNPFIKAGQEAEAQINPLYQQMAGQPVHYLNQLLSQYTESPYFKYAQDRALRAAHGAAAAGGIVGTPSDIENRTEIVNNMVGQNMQQFLQNALGIQGTGIGGLEARTGRGFDAASRLADYLGGTTGAQAGNAAYGQMHKNAGMGNVFNSLSTLFQPGSIFGGPKSSQGGS